MNNFNFKYPVVKKKLLNVKQNEKNKRDAFIYYIYIKI